MNDKDWQSCHNREGISSTGIRTNKKQCGRKNHREKHGNISSIFSIKQQCQCNNGQPYIIRYGKEPADDGKLGTDYCLLIVDPFIFVVIAKNIILVYGEREIVPIGFDFDQRVSIVIEKTQANTQGCLNKTKRMTQE